MIELLAVVIPPPDPVADVRLGRGRDRAGLIDRAVTTARSAVPGCSVITSRIDPELAELVDSGQSDLVLVLDSTFPLVPVEQVRAVLTAAQVPEIAAVAVADVTDTLKLVDRDGLVSVTLDRSRYRVPVGPLAVTPAALASCLAAVPPEASDTDPLARLVTVLDRLVGVDRVNVPDPGRVACRVADGDGAAYAEALLASSSSAMATSTG